MSLSDYHKIKNLYQEKFVLSFFTSAFILTHLLRYETLEICLYISGFRCLVSASN